MPVLPSTRSFSFARRSLTTPPLSESIEVPWRHLVQLGVPAQEAKALARAVAKYYAVKQAKNQLQSTHVRERLPVYWRRLIEAGMPIDDARIAAEAIAWFDTAQKPLTQSQKVLVSRYSALVCRAELWRSGMLLQ